MLKKKIVTIAIIMVFILSATTAMLPQDVEDSQTAGLQDYDSEKPYEEGSTISTEISALAPPPNPRRSWTDGPLVDKVTIEFDNTNWSGGKIVANSYEVANDLTVYIHGISRHANLEVEVLGNEVGGNLVVNVINNPFLYDIIVSVGGNRVGGDIYVSVSNNAVSNLKLGVGENQACGDIEVRANSNTIDYMLTASIMNNKATRYFLIEINNNRFPSGWPQLFHTMNVYIRNNHVVRYDLRIHILSNRMATIGSPQMLIEIKYNGAGVDILIRIVDNKADPGGIIDIDIMDNASDNRMDILVIVNKAFKIFVDVVRNYGCSSVNVVVQPDAISVIQNNTVKCMQTTGADGDGDGLSDLYELMVGTNSSAIDTDNDGLFDGWWDRNGNMRWDPGERYGEIGDPGAALKFTGGIMFLADPNHDANPICADIYIEVDYLTGQKNLPSASVSLLSKVFKDHRIKLHIDNGWAGFGGGQKLPHSCVNKKGKKFLYFDDVHKPSGSQDDFYDFKANPQYFDPPRKDIFHYTIIAHYISYWNASLGKAIYNPNVTARSETPGDDFILAGKAINNWIKKTYTGKARKQNTPLTFAKSFMHELGHNLILPDVYPKSEENKTVMYWKISTAKPLDYKQPSEWAALRLEGIRAPQDPD